MLRLRVRAAWALFSLVIFISSAAVAQGNDAKDKELADFIRANYTKYEYRIAMRDGARLFTAVYVPKDASAQQTYPIMFERTPYTVAPYGVENYPKVLGPNEQFTRSKYIFVYQDVRGRFMSEGQFEDMRPYIPNKSGKQTDESTDTFDTIEWLVKNVQFNNGKAGMWGISYPGFYAAYSLIDSHPALKAVSPQAPIANWFIGDDFHHNGALWLPHMFPFMAAFGPPRPELTTKWPERFDFETPDGYNFYLEKAEPLSKINDQHYKGRIRFWNDVIAHPNYDQFWQARDLPQHLKNVKPAVLVVGGWFDAEDLYGALKTGEAIAKNNPAVPPTLVMGPWFHGGWSRSDGSSLGDARFGSKTSVFYREQIEFPFFEAHLKGKGSLDLPRAYVFETGRNEWEKYDAWPPKNATRQSLYLCAAGRLALSKCPDAVSAAVPVSIGSVQKSSREFDEYVSDPAKPVAFEDQTSTRMERAYMTADQRLQGRRTDVLVYQTEPLEKDITFAGPVRPSLFVSTSGTDSDFVVKLIDVYPDDTEDNDPNPGNVKLGGYQQLVRGEPMRGRFRNSFEKPEPFQPGKLTKVEFVMPDVNHTFRRGHRIMVQVQSTWFPLVDINPQTFVDIYKAKAEDFEKATERVYHTPDAASHVEVMVLPE